MEGVSPLERFDFSSFITILRRYISSDHNKSQVDLLYDLFSYFMDHDQSKDFYFDPGQVCRWMNGSAKISPRISSFYLCKENLQRLECDIIHNILPILCDSSMAVQEIYGLLIQDSTISQQAKARLSVRFPCNSHRDEGAFLATVLGFAMEREFVKRDSKQKRLITTGTFSPVVYDFILDAIVQQAMSIYQIIFGHDPDVIQRKKQEILSDYAQAGVAPDPRLLVQIQASRSLE